MVFYGIVPVTLTAYLQCGDWIGGSMAGALGEMWKRALIVSLGVGLLGANVLTVNNVRDVRDDSRVGKRTKAVILGPRVMKCSYVVCAYLGLGLIWYGMRHALNSWGWAGYAAVGIWMVPVIIALFKFSDQRLNKVLRFTALLLLAAVVWTVFDVCMNHDYLHMNLAHSYITY